jgi:hypothetical protein
VQPLHAPPLQVCPPGQAWQAPPPVPHALAEVPARQVAPSQQPLGQLVESHTQTPLAQR